MGTACLRLGADHERVAPHGLRLLGTLVQLLSALPTESSGTCAVALNASWLPDASCMLLAGLQSSSIKVSMLMLTGLAAVANHNMAPQDLCSAMEGTLGIRNLQPEHRAPCLRQVLPMSRYHC